MSTHEVWKDIKEYEGLYQISNKGNIKNKNKELKQDENKKGYMCITLHKKGKKKKKGIHRIVAETFIQNNESKKQVNHIDGNKKNNSIENLEWVTPKENIRHAEKNKLRNSILKNPNSKLSLKDIQEIRNSDKSTKELMIVYNVSKTTINDIKTFRSWRI